MISERDRDRAHRLGTLAGKAGRGLGGACPYNANSANGDEKTLALVFVRAYVKAGGTVDGLDYGDGAKSTTGTPSSSSATTGTPPVNRGTHRGSSYGHLGLPL